MHGLNSEQQRAVETTEGPLLIIAGAGSGKTRVLTHRTANLVQEKKVFPQNILAVTFTNKAADEMKERLKHLLGAAGDKVWTSTFHSACVRILRNYADRLGYGNNFVIYDDADQKKLIKKVLKDLDMGEGALKPQALISTIDDCKNRLIDAENYASGVKDFLQERKSKAYTAYEKEMKKNNAMDFNDLIMETVKLFKTFPEILERYQDFCRYIMVDEYQDTNTAQYTLVTMLASKYRNLCVVGDDDQSIYGWRGADIRNILDFEKDYTDAVVIKLEQNYRSTKSIIRAAGEVVKNNTGRKVKTLWTDNSHGDPISHFTAVDEHYEAIFVADEVVRLKEKGGCSYKDFAVLYRINAQSRVVEDRLMKEGIPYTIVGGLKFYDRAEIKDILAYLRVVANPADSVSLKRVANTPVRGIGSITIEKIEAYAASNHMMLYDAIGQIVQDSSALPKAARLKLHAFFEMMERFREAADTLGIAMLSEKILEESRLVQALAEERSEEAQSRIENLREFLSVAGEFDETAEERTLRAFLDQVALVSDIGKADEVSDKVTLMTLHSAKGLEFPVVFMVGMEQGLLPHQRAFETPDELEEERRLCYVGITRARRKLYLINATERRIFGEYKECQPSMFFSEMPGDVIERVGGQHQGYSEASATYSDDRYEESQVRPRTMGNLWGLL